MAEPDSLLQAKIKELDFMVGQWAGDGWMQRGPEKSVFKQTENIQFKLDSTAILIEGKGQHDGKVIHNAMAILHTIRPKDIIISDPIYPME